MALGFKIKNSIHEISLKRIIIIAFSIRIAWYLFILFTNPGGFWLYDSNGFWNLAYNLKEHGVFSQDAQEPLTPDCFRTPLYPLIMYPTLYFDINGYSVPLINIFFDCLTCLLIYKTILLAVKNENYAKTGSLIYALHIPAILFSNFVLTESIFAFLVVSFVFLFLKLIASPHWKNVVYCGLAGGLCVMCKPIGFILIFPAVLFLFITKMTVKRIVTVFLFGISFYAVQFPWMLRNKSTFGRYFNSVLGEHLLLEYHAAHVYAKVNAINYFDAKEILINQCFRGLNYDPYKHPYEYAKHIQERAYGILWKYKFVFLREHVKECIKFFIQPSREYANYQLGKHGYTKIFSWTFVAVQVFVSFVLLSAIAFVFYKRMRKQVTLNWFVYFLSTLILVFSQFNTMPYTDSRMRLPVDPLLIILFVVLIFQLIAYKDYHNQRIRSLILKFSR